MGKRKDGQAHFLRSIGQYGAETNIYALSKTLKGKPNADFLVISKVKKVSGLPLITALKSDLEGKILDNTPVISENRRDFDEVLAEIGYILV